MTIPATPHPSAVVPVVVPAALHARRWWRRPWIVPLAAISVGFLAFSLPPYLTGDPAQSRVPQPANFPAHYALLVAHVLFGAVALVTACLQIWPRFRKRYPVAHRMIGRVYVFGGVLPAGFTALPIAAFSPFGPVASASSLLLACVWLTCTVAGYRMARQRRYVEHRRWMIRSFALTASIVTNRLWGPIVYLALASELHTTFQSNEQLLTATVAGVATWLGWVIPLLAAQWWLERGEPASERSYTPVRARP